MRIGQAFPSNYVAGFGSSLPDVCAAYDGLSHDVETGWRPLIVVWIRDAPRPTVEVAMLVAERIRWDTERVTTL